MHVHPLHFWLTGDWVDPPPPPEPGEQQRPIYRKIGGMSFPHGKWAFTKVKSGEGRRNQG